MAKGFTLFEMLVALSLVSFLLLFSVPQWQDHQHIRAFLLEQQRLYVFLRQLQARVENSAQVWLLVVQRNLMRRQWCLSAQIKDEQLCDCLNPINCPPHVSAHFYYPQATEKTMVAAKYYYPEILTRLVGTKNTFEASCFTLQSAQDRVFFTFSNDGLISIKPANAVSGCQNYGVNE